MADRERTAELVLRSRRGDRAAFAELVRRYENAAYATALTYTHHVEDAQDIVQDAFVIAYCKLAQLREGGNFGSWFWSIVKRRALESVRRRQIVQFVSDSAETVIGAFAEASLDRLAAESRNAALWEAVFALPEKYREVVLLYYLDGFSYGRVADYLGLPVTTVKGRLHQSRVRLKEELSPDEREELAMKKAKVGTRVEEAIAKIAKEEIHETVPLGDTEHVVLFCDQPGDIEICRTDGADVVLSGTKASIGLTEEEARRSVQTILVRHDQVESYLQSGPHEGELFFTSVTDDGKPLGIASSVSRLWHTRNGGSLGDPFLHSDVYPELRFEDDELQQTVKAALGKATRITINRKKMEDIHLPKEAYTENAGRGFAPNCFTAEEVHGPRGMVHLVVAVPKAKAITVLQGTWLDQHLRVWGLGSNLNIVGWLGVELEDIQGDVRLLTSSVKKVKGIRGRLEQTDFNLGRNSGEDYRMRRIPMDTSVYQDIRGDVSIDVMNGHLEISDVHGKLRMRNRYGETRVHINKRRDGDKCDLVSDSGTIVALIREEVVSQMSMTFNTLAGEINCSALRDLGSLHVRNDLQMNTVSTIFSKANLAPEHLEADLVIKTASGDIRIEKTK